jgi:hypothetical protein
MNHPVSISEGSTRDVAAPTKGMMKLFNPILSSGFGIKTFPMKHKIPTAISHQELAKAAIMK